MTPEQCIVTLRAKFESFTPPTSPTGTRTGYRLCWRSLRPMTGLRLRQLVGCEFGSMERPVYREHIRVMVQLRSEDLNSNKLKPALFLTTFDTWIQLVCFPLPKQRAIDSSLDSHSVAGFMIAFWHSVVLETTLAYRKALKVLYRGGLHTRTADNTGPNVTAVY